MKMKEYNELIKDINKQIKAKKIVNNTVRILAQQSRITGGK